MNQVTPFAEENGSRDRNKKRACAKNVTSIYLYSLDFVPVVVVVVDETKDGKQEVGRAEDIGV